jgi:hypothetical protein
VLTLSRFATSGIFKSGESMKPYLAEYLRSRDLHHYEQILVCLTTSTPNPCKRLIRSTLEMLMPRLREWYPSLSAEEMRRAAYARLADLPHIPEEYTPKPDPVDPDEQYDNDDE